MTLRRLQKKTAVAPKRNYQSYEGEIEKSDAHRRPWLRFPKRGGIKVPLEKIQPARSMTITDTKAGLRLVYTMLSIGYLARRENQL